MLTMTSDDCRNPSLFLDSSAHGSASLWGECRRCRSFLRLTLTARSHSTDTSSLALRCSARTSSDASPVLARAKLRLRVAAKLHCAARPFVVVKQRALLDDPSLARHVTRLVVYSNSHAERPLGSQNNIIPLDNLAAVYPRMQEIDSRPCARPMTALLKRLSPSDMLSDGVHGTNSRRIGLLIAIVWRVLPAAPVSPRRPRLSTPHSSFKRSARRSSSSGFSPTTIAGSDQVNRIHAAFLDKVLEPLLASLQSLAIPPPHDSRKRQVANNAELRELLRGLNSSRAPRPAASSCNQSAFWTRSYRRGALAVSDQLYSGLANPLEQPRAGRREKHWQRRGLQRCLHHVPQKTLDDSTAVTGTPQTPGDVSSGNARLAVTALSSAAATQRRGGTICQQKLAAQACCRCCSCSEGSETDHGTSGTASA